ncbi:unnamed protein product, partial [Scytosiphon promiscuus]
MGPSRVCSSRGDCAVPNPNSGAPDQTKGRGSSERHIRVNGTAFKIPKRYNHLEAIGKGSYGVVCS